MAVYQRGVVVQKVDVLVAIDIPDSATAAALHKCWIRRKVQYRTRVASRQNCFRSFKKLARLGCASAVGCFRKLHDPGLGYDHLFCTLFVAYSTIISPLSSSLLLLEQRACTALLAPWRPVLLSPVVAG